MAVEVNGKSFESYSDALDEYISSHLGEKICIPKQRNTDHLETAEVLFTSPTRRKRRKVNQSYSNDRTLRHEKPSPKTDVTTTTSGPGTLGSRDHHVRILERLEGPLQRELTPSATDDLCNCSVLYGVRTPAYAYGPAQSTPYRQTRVALNFQDEESVCTDDLLQADCCGGKDATGSRTKDVRLSTATLSRARRNSTTNVMSNSCRAIGNVANQSMSSDSMETLKRVLFDMQQLALQFQVVNETATSKGTDN